MAPSVQKRCNHCGKSLSSTYLRAHWRHHCSKNENKEKRKRNKSLNKSVKSPLLNKHIKTTFPGILKGTLEPGEVKEIPLKGPRRKNKKSQLKLGIKA